MNLGHPGRRLRLAALATVLACTLSACMDAEAPPEDEQGSDQPVPAALAPTETAESPRAAVRTKPRPPTVNLARLRRTAPTVDEPWPWGVDPDPRRGHRVCADAKSPKARTSATFARPDGSATLTRGIITVICAAAPKATIKIAIYYIENDGPDVQQILDALSFVHVRRDVAMRIVADRRRGDFSPAFAPTADDLRQFASVNNCIDGCRSELPPRGEKGGSPQVEVQHHKFMVLSDTFYSSRPSPIVWLASGNWAHRQLHVRSQSGFILRDRGLAEAFTVRFDNLYACAKHGCSVWNKIVQRRGLPLRAYGIVRKGGIWFDRSERAWRGGKGQGSSVFFSPWRTRDPIARRFEMIRCTAEHNTVWTAQRVITRSRAKVVSRLAALQDQGCDVRILVSGNSMKHIPVFRDGYLYVRDQGLDVNCVEGVHDKFILIDAIHKRTGDVSHSLTAGTQGLMRRALVFSDEAMVTLTTTDTTKKARRTNQKAWRAYADHFQRLASRPEPCPD